jgi:hypothetical protein
MKKKFYKVLRKQTYTVLFTIIACLGFTNYFNNKTYELHKELAAKEVKIQIDSIRIAESHKLREELLERQEIGIELERNKLKNNTQRLQSSQAQLSDRLNELDQSILLSKLIESLRSDFGAIEPGVQVIDDDAYMATYRKHEATYALAVETAKNLEVYERYEAFFKQREGVWNMITKKI